MSDVPDPVMAEYRARWAREDEMLRFFDNDQSLMPGKLTYEALARKFDLEPHKVAKLVQRHNRRRRKAEEAERARATLHALRAEVDQLRTHERCFEWHAEQMWLDLEWLASELEKRRAQ